MKNRLSKKRKYFLVSYKFNNGSGCITMYCDNMDFLNRDKTIEIIKQSGDIIGDVVIVSIMKLTKKEYDCWRE